MRADQWLVERGYYTTRARAADAIKRGCVTLNNVAVRKPGQTIPDDAVVAISDSAQTYVSRSALKLVAALDGFDLSAEGRDCLDIGASTGGFTQVLLERGAARVCSIDVGHGQLHPLLQSDHRVTSLEGINARDLDGDDLPFVPNVVVVDVSFISLSLILPAIAKVIAEEADIVLLFKPQFEVGREHIGKGGLVTDQVAVETAREALLSAMIDDHGWSITGAIASPIKGGDGNQEYLIGAKALSSSYGTGSAG